ncbi:sensor histidine kinase [Nonomuraea soli]|uniref:Sensor-like histidine kinase SenX3 n=1 Tax=Nonomuraea soli TaxID=1032476 RepID=A0A7W0CDN9_9ACTN|nr:HAMP domain-containing sensor histidine kinase [Nonomuraea soli]MBA2889248.1 signal transduction histidine kinase [Nonomuraea soli]
MDHDHRLLLQARRRLTVQVAGAISAVLAIFGAVVFCVGLHDQHSSSRRELASIAQRATLDNPPPCVWLFSWSSPGAARGSPGAPAALPLASALDQVAAGGRERVEEVTAGGRTYLVHTLRRGGVAVQAAMDLHAQASERSRLLHTLIVSELAGLLAALLIGQIVARRAIAPLGQALARQRRFAADLSHELRTPLTRLHTRAQLLARRLRRGTEPAVLADEVDRLVASSKELGEVVEDLLLSARFAQLDRTFHPVDLAELAADQIALEQARAHSLGIRIEQRCRGTAGPVVSGVPSALRRVISALIDNALRHTGAGGHVWVTVSGGPKLVELVVRDDGVGLDPGDSERLFVRYASGNRGFGLGLALVREVVEGHGGTITADGRPGVGAAFIVRLPACPAPDRHDPADVWPHPPAPWPHPSPRAEAPRVP